MSFRQGAGRLCLDFVHTLRDRGTGRPVEDLPDGAALAAWVRQFGPVAPPGSSVPLVIHAGAQRLREAIHTLVVASATGSPAATADTANATAQATADTARNTANDTANAARNTANDTARNTASDPANAAGRHTSNAAARDAVNDTANAAALNTANATALNTANATANAAARDVVNDAAARSVPVPFLDAGGALRWQAADPVTATLALVARDALDLATSAAVTRVRACADPRCGALFLDGSRTGTRRWCSADPCGNRARKRQVRGTLTGAPPPG